MNPVRALTLSFEGQPLTTVTWNGQPAWVAREIGQRLGYVQRGKRLHNRHRCHPLRHLNRLRGHIHR